MVIFDLPTRRARLTKLELLSAQPNFWDDPQAAQTTLQQLARVREEITPWDALTGKVDELIELIELSTEAEEAEAEELAHEIERDTTAVQAAFEQLHLQTLFSDEYDRAHAIVSINSGAGGTEAADWASMLARMYGRWAQLHSFELEVVDESQHEEAGLKSWTAMIKGLHAYGHLKAERGVHRLIRLSPFDANHKRHTSFASVDVIPDSEANLKLDISPDQLKVETMRSSGPGGQHAQKNETAIRILHIPTGITAQSRTERSQSRNRDMAMKVLKARLFAWMRDQKQQELDKLRGQQKDVAFGSQIRTYYFHPGTLVKDHRTSHETSNINAVMDGDLDGFMRSYLEQNSGQSDS